LTTRTYYKSAEFNKFVWAYLEAFSMTLNLFESTGIHYDA